MFITTWLMILFLALGILFLTFIAWLARSLEGYPALLISQAGRDAAQAPKPALLANPATLLDTLANHRSIRTQRELLPAAGAVPRVFKAAERSKAAPT